MPNIYLPRRTAIVCSISATVLYRSFVFTNFDDMLGPAYFMCPRDAEVISHVSGNMTELIRG